jgi:hypothetical protein
MADKPSLTAVEPKVIEWEGVKYLDVPGAEVLKAALEANLANAVVIGWDTDGDFFFASTEANHSVTLWLLAHAQKMLLDGGPE